MIGIHQNIQSARSHAILGRRWEPVWGASHIEEKILGCIVSNAPGSFAQVNTEAAELLYTKALEEAELSKDSVVLDLYCGGGALTIAAAKRSRFAVGIKAVPSSD